MTTTESTTIAMVAPEAYNYKPKYYTSTPTFQEAMTSICKTILNPFKPSNRLLLLPTARANKKHSDDLKWQQEAFHKILHLIALHSEGLVPITQVNAYRSQLLQSLISSSDSGDDPPDVLRGKLLFLQELLSAKCVSTEEYETAKRALVEGERWSVVDLGDKDDVFAPSKKVAAAEETGRSWGFIGLGKTKKKEFNESNSTPEKRKRLRGLFRKTASEAAGEGEAVKLNRCGSKRQQWGFNRLKKWKSSGEGDCLLTPHSVFDDRQISQGLLPSLI